jgi:gliding motility-associated protein GldC
MKKSEIKFTVTLDDNKHPESIYWVAEDSGTQGEKESKAVMISLWDKKEMSTMRIDLWTKEMMVEEMHQFYYESLMSMADTFQNATNNTTSAEAMRAFARQFGKEIGVLK